MDGQATRAWVEEAARLGQLIDNPDSDEFLRPGDVVADALLAGVAGFRAYQHELDIGVRVCGEEGFGQRLPEVGFDVEDVTMEVYALPADVLQTAREMARDLYVHSEAEIIAGGARMLGRTGTWGEGVDLIVGYSEEETDRVHAQVLPLQGDYAGVPILE